MGKPTEVNRSFFELVLGSGLVPVVSSIALGPDSQLYNVNADQMASACASGTGCASLIYLTDVPGVRDENGSVLRTMGKSEILSMRSRGILSGGMLPKTSSCLEALEGGSRFRLDTSRLQPGYFDQICRRNLRKERKSMETTDDSTQAGRNSGSRRKIPLSHLQEIRAFLFPWIGSLCVRSLRQNAISIFWPESP